MAFIAKNGAQGFPSTGDTVHVYETGTTTHVTGLVDLDGNALDNTAGFVLTSAEFWGFTPPNRDQVDVYWADDASYIVKKGIFRDFDYATINRVTETISGSPKDTFTVSYSVGAGNVMVHLNAVLLDPSEYTATNGTSVVLGATAPVGAVVDILGIVGVNVGTVSASAVTYENLSANGDIGTGATQVAQGDHIHPTTTVDARTTTSETLAGTEGGKLLTFNNAGATTFTIPANASVSFATNTVISLLNIGTGTVTIGITSDTLSQKDSAFDLETGATATLVKTASTVWWLTGGVV